MLVEESTRASLIAAELEKQVTARLREKGLVFWLDREGHYTRFVDGLQLRHQEGQFFAPVVAFRGSFLETLLALEPYETGLDPTPLLLHLPGHTDVSVRGTPLLEAYKCGTRFERALDTLVREVAAGRVSPEQTERYLGQGRSSFEEAEEWLASLMDRDPKGFAATLKTMQPQWVLEGLVEAPSDFSRRIQNDEDLESVREYLCRHTGFSPEFQAFFLEGEPTLTVRTLAEGWMAWLLCVEYVHDLNRSPTMSELQPLRALSAPLRKSSADLVGLLRKRYPDAYCVYAMQTEARLETELAAGSPEELGKIDTFSREDTRLLEGALACLEAERWTEALNWATSRLESPSVWLQKDLSRRLEWSLVRDAADLGERLARAGRPLRAARSLEDALVGYTGEEGAHLVDRAHRHFEQERMQHLTPRLRHYPGLERASTLVRRRYREWLDDLTASFTDLCTREGFLPPPQLQQRNLYEQVVHPLTQASEARVAYFMVDALRFEMASELASRLEGQVHLKARLSELPSITAVGMNVLAPVCRDGNLTLDARPFSGFRAGEYSVKNPQQRVQAMRDRSLTRHTGSHRTPLALSLSEVSNMTPERLSKQVKNATLIVVHSREIDAGGEADVGLATFDRWLGQLRSAVQHLHNAGVEEFVVTSDHGFLLLDDSREPVVYNADTVDRRFILTDAPLKEETMAGVSLKSLNYGGSDGYLMFLRDSRVFKGRGVTASTFVHGGNSLQERVIPVLTVSYRTGRAPQLASYRLEASVLEPVMGCHRLRVTLLDQSDGVLGFAVPPILPIALRVPSGSSAEVIVQDALQAQLVNQQLQLEVGQPAEIFFKLVGGSSDKVPLELYHPDATEKVDTLRLPVFFEVSRTTPAPSAPQALSWVEHFEDEAVVRVFRHVESYGSVDEAELIVMLGGSRNVRKFARHFEEYLRLLPFHVRIEGGEHSKRYVRD